ncbi:MAG: DNA gyrase inhibitor YacG [Planctomycetaceae bacterium]|nr:DNA gyrase inhibitor YacG [Planctomycetaceae bacterium]
MIGPALCPICNEPVHSLELTENEHFPFCSKRCQEIDFLRWCKGEYAIVEPLTPEKLVENFSPEDLEDLLDQ